MWGTAKVELDAAQLGWQTSRVALNPGASDRRCPAMSLLWAFYDQGSAQEQAAGVREENGF